MTDGGYQARRILLEIPDANRLGKWASLWADLTHAAMALLERSQLQVIAATVFTRRALWESAIVSYARMQTIGEKRRLEHESHQRQAPRMRSHGLLLTRRCPRRPRNVLQLFRAAQKVEGAADLRCVHYLPHLTQS